MSVDLDVMEGRRQVSATFVAKHVVLLSCLVGLAVVTGLSLRGTLSLGVGDTAYALLSLLALLAIVLAFRASLKSISCSAASAWVSLLRRPVSFRILLFNSSAWDDVHDWAELGPWTLLALLISLAPLVLAAFLPYSYSTFTVYGGNVTTYWKDSGGVGGQEKFKYKIMTSIIIMPNETTRMVNPENRLRPRYFCKETQRSAHEQDVFHSTVHLPPWPIVPVSTPPPLFMGDRGQRIKMSNVDAFTLNSTCSMTKDRWPLWDQGDFQSIDPGKQPNHTVRIRHAMDSGSSSNSSSLIPNDTLVFLQEYEGPDEQNLYCCSRVKRALLSVTWTVNSTGYYVEGCSSVDLLPFNRSYVDISQVDTWLNLTVRNTNKYILHPVLDGMTPADATQYKVMFSLIHLVTWLFASSREGDPTHDPATSSTVGTAYYEVQPLYAYYEASSAVFVLLVVAAVLLLSSLVLRIIPHGFHGGSVTQMIYLSRKLTFYGWGGDPELPQPGRTGTAMNVVLDRNSDSLQVADRDMRVRSGDSTDGYQESGGANPVVVEERDYGESHAWDHSTTATTTENGSATG